MKKTITKNSMISFFLKHIPCSCLIYLLALANAHALPQKKEANKKIEPKVQLSLAPVIPEEKMHIMPKIQLIILNDLNDTQTLNLTLEEENTSHINFKKMKPKSKLKIIKERYLTLYSAKKEKIKATYLQGAYAINYTQSW